jgi:outer membrane protein OmpA-like peptidoglycan-associated protein
MRRLAAALAVFLALAGCATEPGRDFLVFFPTDALTLSASADGVVAGVAKLAAGSHSAHLVVEGQADGGKPHDAELAYQRGQAVVAALVAAGVDAARIEIRPSAPPAETTGLAAHKVIIHFIR